MGQVLAVLATTMNPHSFDTWARPTRGLRHSPETLTVAVPAPEFAEMMERFRETVLEAMTQAQLPHKTVEYEPRLDLAAAAVGSYGPGRIGKKGVILLQLAFLDYSHRIFRAKLHYQVEKVLRLAWATANLGYTVESFSQLKRKEANHLLRVMAGREIDMAWPRRRKVVRIDERR